MEWQPIETAPRDGTAIIICIDGGVVGEAYWKEEVAIPEDQGWWWANTSPGDYYADRISLYGPHKPLWVPLPTPPGLEVMGVDEIPDNVMEAARIAVDRMPQRSEIDDPVEFWDAVLVQVARAILAYHGKQRD